MNQKLEQLKTGLTSLKTKVNGKTTMAATTAAAMLATTGVTAFASPAVDSPTIAITEDMLKPLTEGIVQNVAVVLPIGLGIFAIFLGIRIIPGLISRFVRM